MSTWNKVIVKGFIYIILILLLLCFSDDVAIYFWESSHTEVTAFGTLLASIIAIGAILGLIIQLYRTERQNKIQRTYELIDKYHEPDFFEYVFDAYLFLSSNLLPYQKEEIFFNRSHPQFRETSKKCRAIFIFYENICYMYNKNLIDKKAFYELMGGTIPGFYRMSEPLIKEYRKKLSDDKIYSEWEACSKDIEAHLERIRSADAKN